MNRNRRNLLKSAAAVVAATGAIASAETSSKPEEKIHYMGPKPDKTPLFSGAVSYGNLLFVAGQGRTSRVILLRTRSLSWMR